MFRRRIRANGTIAITANPLGTTNQNRPDSPQRNVIAELIITAIAHVQTAMTEPTPKPKPTFRSAMMKSWVLRTKAVLIANDRTNKKSPNPIMVAKPSAGVRSAVSDRIDLSIANLLTRMTSARCDYDYDFVYQLNHLTVRKKNNLIAPDGRRDADLLQ